MLKNYLKITFRSLLKNKGYTSINVLGLTLGIASALIITLIIRYELGFDQHHRNKDSIYRVVRHSTNASGLSTKPNVTYPLAQALRDQLPNLEEHIALIHHHGEDQLVVGDQKGFEENIIFADPQLFSIFDIPVLSGNPIEDLKDPGKVFITPNVAQKFFGTDSPIGKRIKLGGELDLEIVGLLSDKPENSHLKMHVVVSYASFNKSFTGGFDIDEWGVSMSGFAYLNLPNKDDVVAVQKTLESLAIAHYADESAAGEKTEFLLQALDDIHFNQKYSNGTFESVDEDFIFILSCIGVFILIIACVNFVNMSTALATKRAKEVGMRRTLGAGKSELIAQFMGETFIITLFALTLALATVERLLPYISDFLQKTLQLDLFTDSTMMFSILTLLAFVTVAAGLYPAIVLASYQPVHALKVKLTHSQKNGFSLRIGLVAFQFVISQILIISTIIIAAQTDYFLNKPLGFDKDMIISIPLAERDSLKNHTLKQRLLQNTAIKNFSFAVGAPTSDNNIGSSFTVDEYTDDQQYDISLKIADENYMSTYGIELVNGRWFNDTDPMGDAQGLQVKKGFVVNETAVRQMGYSIDEVIGKTITIGINSISAPVIGVVQDFHMRSFHEEIVPMVILDIPNFYYQAGIKVSREHLDETIGFLKSTWEEAYPEHIFEYDFLDEKIATNYEAEQRTFTLFKIFAGISIFICCIGLFGLVSFIVTSKTKEVGVRKVLGASVSSILLLFSTDFLKIMGIAFVIAAPIVWYALQNWLNNFAYHIDLQVGHFLFGLLGTVLITILSISIQSVKAATANPVDALIDE
jgi:ABC-type antimicrobial peptide transport system permease subunit